MNNIIKRTWKQNTIVNIEDLRGMTFQAESGAHTFEISAVDADNNPITLSGTPSGTMLRPDNTDQALTCSISGGKLYATLPAGCYDVPGRAGITIFLTSDSQKTALYAAVVSVSRTQSGTAAPGTTASVVDLVNAINAAISQIPASDANLKAAMAPTYSGTGLYSVGQCAWDGGVLYECTVPITEAENPRVAAHWKTADLSESILNLRSAFNKSFDDNLDVSVILDWQDGQKYDIGSTSAVQGPVADNNYRSLKISCAENEKFTINVSLTTSNKYWAWAFADSSLDILSHSTSTDLNLSNVVIKAPENAAWLIVNDKKSGGNCYKGENLLNLSMQGSEISVDSTNYQNYSNANNYKGNKIYRIHSSINSNEMVSNLPEYGKTGYLMAYAQICGVNVGVQIYTNVDNQYFRTIASGGAGDWRKIIKQSDADAMLSLSVHGSEIVVDTTNYQNYSDANDYTGNKIYRIHKNITNQHVANLPEYGITGYLMMYAQVGDVAAGVQIFSNMYHQYFRVNAGAAAGEWHILNNDNEFVDDVGKYFIKTCLQKPIEINSSTGVYIFGDSITQDCGITPYGFTWGSIMAQRTGCTVYNYGYGGASFIHTTNRVITRVNEVTDWSHCNIAIVAAGTNDSTHDVTGSELTECVEEVIDAIRENAPNAKIIFITPIRRNSKALNLILVQVAACISNVAMQNGCSVINGFDFPIQTFSDDWTTTMLDPTDVHPTEQGLRVYAEAVMTALLD